MPNSTTISTLTPYNEAQSTLVGTLKNILKTLNILDSPGIELFATTNGLGLRLHNPAIRPTVYSLEMKRTRHDGLGAMVLDTIIRENKAHESLKVSYSIQDIDELINTIKRLASQPCTGTVKETSEKFVPMGLLFTTRESLFNH